MAIQLEPVFMRLRDILAAHAADFRIAKNSAHCYMLEAAVGPATLQSWGGKARKPTVPVAWVDIRKAYVSYHLMGLSGNPGLVKMLSTGLRARMQGKTCFNFRVIDEDVFPELANITAQSLHMMKQTGYIAS